MAQYNPPRVILQTFSVDDYTYNNEQFITLTEANQRYVVKSGDVVTGGLIFNGANTYN